MRPLKCYCNMHYHFVKPIIFHFNSWITILPPFPILLLHLLTLYTPPHSHNSFSNFIRNPMFHLRPLEPVHFPLWVFEHQIYPLLCQPSNTLPLYWAYSIWTTHYWHATTFPWLPSINIYIFVPGHLFRLRDKLQSLYLRKCFWVVPDWEIGYALSYVSLEEDRSRQSSQQMGTLRKFSPFLFPLTKLMLSTWDHIHL